VGPRAGLDDVEKGKFWTEPEPSYTLLFLNMLLRTVFVWQLDRIFRLTSANKGRGSTNFQFLMKQLSCQPRRF
jgi:hypothetical protein